MQGDYSALFQIDLVCLAQICTMEWFGRFTHLSCLDLALSKITLFTRAVVIKVQVKVQDPNFSVSLPKANNYTHSSPPRGLSLFRSRYSHGT